MRSPKKHQQKEPPYRKTLSKGQFPITIISISTSRNTNIAFLCKICCKNINDKDAVIQFDLCQFWVHLKCNNFNHVDYNIVKDQMILGFVYPIVVQFYHLEIWQKDFSFSVLNKSDIEIFNKNSSVLLKAPSTNSVLLFNQFNNSSSEQNIDPENVVNSIIKFSLKKEVSLCSILMHVQLK